MSIRPAIPWFRILLCLAYAVGAVAAVRYEHSSRQILAKANQLRSDQKYGAAAVAYQLVVERYSFSLAVPEAQAALVAIQPALSDSSLQRLTTTWLESKVSMQFDPYRVAQLPLVVWPTATIVLILAFVTRCFRRSGWAMLCLLLAVAAGAIAYVQLASIGLISLERLHPLEDAAMPLLEKPKFLYPATVGLLIVTCLLTLAPRKPAGRYAARHSSPSGTTMQRAA